MPIETKRNDLPREEFTRARGNRAGGLTILQTIAARTKRTLNGCLEWLGPLGEDDYPVLKVNGERWRLSRLIWVYHHGAIPEGTLVRHIICDNKRCCDITHMALGLHDDNVDDAHRLGGYPSGEAKPAAKLTEAQVIAIRNDKRSTVEIAAAYGIPSSRISLIQRGLEWQKTAGPIRSEKLPLSGEDNVNVKLTEAIVRKILVSPLSIPKLAKKYGVSTNTIGSILRRETWTHIQAPVADRVDHRRRLSLKMVKEIKQAEGSINAIAQRFGLDHKTVKRIRTGLTYSDV